ncbi:MAG: tRNA pseudouridine(13) synthase TruD [Phycisphaerae bacterium]|nr:tRNA pseudouridine(13) synthase TruD [Phycisphaerae bacterium]
MTIRRQPEDFLVEERLGAAFSSALRDRADDAAPYACFELTKQAITTPAATHAFARAIGVRNDDVQCAGLKDRHAKTIQFITARVDAGKVERFRDAPLEQHATAAVDEPESDLDDHDQQSDESGEEPSGQTGWSARLVGWTSAPITSDAIDGNRFTIEIRDLAQETCSEMDRRVRLLSDDGIVYVTNYFGAQRFGSARHGKGFAARHLLKGEFEQALRLLVGTPAREDHGKTRVMTRAASSDWGNWPAILAKLPRMPERAAFEALAAGKDAREAFSALPAFTQIMCVEAFQSHLWNEVARRFVTRSIKGTHLRSDDAFGPMFFARARDMHALTRKLIIPLLAPDAVLRQPWREDVESVLRDEGLTLESLRIPGLRRPFFADAPRSLVTRIERFDLGAPHRDALDPQQKRLARTISFELPRGAYATVVLRAIGQ